MANNRYFSDLAGTLLSTFKVGRASISAASLTNNRTFTLPDVNSTFAVLQGVQTFIGIKTFTDDIFITTTGASGGLVIDSPAGSLSEIWLRSGTSMRWSIRKNNTAESGSNAGGDLDISRYDDSGVIIARAVRILRSTGVVDFTVMPTVGGSLLASWATAPVYKNSGSGYNLNSLAIGEKVTVATSLTNSPTYTGVTYWLVECHSTYLADNNSRVQLAYAWDKPVHAFRVLQTGVWSSWVYVDPTNIPLLNALNAFTVTPTFPTATLGDNTTSGATTAFVTAAGVALKAAANTWGAIQTIYVVGGVSGLIVDSDLSPQQVATVVWRRGGLNRWQIQLVGDETGVANGGGTLSLRAHGDTGTQIGVVCNIDRPTQVLTLLQSPLIPTPATTDNSTKAASTAFVNAYSSRKKTCNVLASPVSSSSTTAADITGWSVSVVAGRKYLLKILGTYSTAAATTGCKLQMVSAGGAAGTAVGYIEGGINRANTAPLSTVVKNIAGSYGLITSGNGVVGDMCHLTAEIFIDCTTSGTVTFQWGSEIAGSAAQLEAGSVLIVEDVT